jgi:hypothetical protein
LLHGDVRNEEASAASAENAAGTWFEVPAAEVLRACWCAPSAMPNSAHFTVMMTPCRPATLPSVVSPEHVGPRLREFDGECRLLILSRGRCRLEFGVVRASPYHPADRQSPPATTAARSATTAGPRSRTAARCRAARCCTTRWRAGSTTARTSSSGSRAASATAGACGTTTTTSCDGRDVGRNIRLIR